MSQTLWVISVFHIEQKETFSSNIVIYICFFNFTVIHSIYIAFFLIIRTFTFYLFDLHWQAGTKKFVEKQRQTVYSEFRNVLLFSLPNYFFAVFAPLLFQQSSYFLGLNLCKTRVRKIVTDGVKSYPWLVTLWYVHIICWFISQSIGLFD